MRFIWITAALVAGCVGAPLTSPMDPNGDVRKMKIRSGPPTDGNVDPVNDGDVTNNISFLRLC
ncbi:hypothetical protein PENARI_c013G05439 [Penicillium arizonense]|uniref:Uncharacterized protein n=1 Tax=Penicillium arizonense TaxID=1835702 RepID=A0A1F5LE36_PENAI|nr:hypothetical protein PENARI_c013G05439 [Penicillium arizonense]OGE51316.1 hypothetical protein PENARI_c013G05439 [Penicillium arizonense]